MNCKSSFIRLGSIIALIVGLTSCGENTEQAEPLRPNIIVILADDLGFGDVGFNGQTHFDTPHIDRLAQNGLIFTDHYSGSTVCAPSRSALLTGQHTGHTPVRGNHEIKPEGQWPLPDGSVTAAELLQEAGYQTGIFGKWGLGYPGSEGDPNNQGFDEFFGYNCQRLAHNYYPYYLWHNQDTVTLKENSEGENVTYAPNLIHEKTLDFIRNNRDTTFFLYYASVIPHAELFAPEEYMELYRGKLLPEKSYDGADKGEERFRDGGYGSQPEAHAAFAGMVTLLDDQVGEIVALLDTLGIADNTLILFTSDNGPHQEGGADPDYFDSNAGFKGYKRDLYEGGIRVPTVASWPGTIQPGLRTDHISAFWDYLPTFADLAGVQHGTTLDGISFAPLLTGSGDQKSHDYLYWEFHERGGRVALRKGPWKAVRYNVKKDPDSTIELYDLSIDPAESNNIADEHPEKVEELSKLLESARTPSEVFTFK